MPIKKASPIKHPAKPSSPPKPLEMGEIKGLQTRPLNDSKTFLVETTNKYIMDTGARIDEAAKQLSTLSGLVQGLLIAAFAFGNFQTKVSGWLFIPFVTTIVSLLGSFIFCSMVYSPISLETNDRNLTDMAHAFAKIANHKFKWLRLGQMAFILGTLSLIILLVSIVLTPTVKSNDPIYIIIQNPTETITPTITPSPTSFVSATPIPVVTLSPGATSTP